MNDGVLDIKGGIEENGMWDFQKWKSGNRCKSWFQR